MAKNRKLVKEIMVYPYESIRIHALEEHKHWRFFSYVAK